MREPPHPEKEEWLEKVRPCTVGGHPVDAADERRLLADVAHFVPGRIGDPDVVQLIRKVPDQPAMTSAAPLARIIYRWWCGVVMNL